MDNPKRINPTSVTPTVARQTPKNEFGEVLAGTLGQVAHLGGAIARGVTSGSPVVSAAVSGIAAMASMATAAAPVVPIAARGAGAVVRASAMTGGPEDRGDAWDLLQAQNMSTQQYLVLQNEMQRESREFNTISNVLKVRHDSAKAAINNIR